MRTPRTTKPATSIFVLLSPKPRNRGKRRNLRQPSHVIISAAIADGKPELLYRVPLAPALDGNTVDMQLEQAAFAESTVRYQSSLMFVSARNLLLAITGQQ